MFIFLFCTLCYYYRLADMLGSIYVTKIATFKICAVKCLILLNGYFVMLLEFASVLKMA